MTGKATTHNDESHDQRVDQWIEFNHPTDESQSFKLHLLGGTTKCARVFSRYLFAEHVRNPGCFVGKRVLEIGAGSGLVGMVLARLGAFVVFTDQAPVLPLLKANLSENEDELAKGKALALQSAEAAKERVLSELKLNEGENSDDDDDLAAMIDPERWWRFMTPSTQVHELHWGNPAHETAVIDCLKYYPAQAYRELPTVEPSNAGRQFELVKYFDIVLGSDLIYAHENIDPLVATFRKFFDTGLVSNSLLTPGTAQALNREQYSTINIKVYLAAIERFAWESRFFSGMGSKFEAVTELVEGDIKVFAFQERR